MSDQNQELPPLEEQTVDAGAVPAEPYPVGLELEAVKAELATITAEVAALKAERDDLKDQMLRKVADFDNYRKRMLKEKDEARQFANSGLLEDLCQVLDDFERAIRSSEGTRDYDAFHSGIVMIEGQFVSMLERKYSLKRLEGVGKPFNPEHHEAIAMEPAEEGKETVIVEEYQKGYKLHDRVLRTSKVKVGHLKTVETKEGE